MLSNATWTAWSRQHKRKVRQKQRKGKARRRRRGANRDLTKDKRNENKDDERICGRPGQGPALLYRGTGLCQEDRFQSGPISLADRGLARGAGRHRVAAGAE